MVCPFLVRNKENAYCEILTETIHARLRPHPKWVCEQAWRSYCPQFFSDVAPSATANNKRDFTPETEDDVPPWRLRHVNRLGGMRSLIAELQ